MCQNLRQEDDKSRQPWDSKLNQVGCLDSVRRMADAKPWTAKNLRRVSEIMLPEPINLNLAVSCYYLGHLLQEATGGYAGV
jgi:hypothetical protein